MKTKNIERHSKNENNEDVILCRTCNIVKLLDEFPNHPHGQKGKDTRCKECRNEYTHNYHKIHKEELKESRVEYWRTYKENNIEIIRERKRRYKKTLKARLANNLRTRIHHALKGLCKSKKTLDLLGCDVEFFKKHLEAQFTEGMTWDNYGKDFNGWQVDHIIPCAKFDLSKDEDQYACFHYTNLQPLWAIDNLIKRAS